MIMIVKLVDYFKWPMIFIGADNWGSDKDSQIGNLPTIEPYTAIHIIPWSLNMNTHQLSLFKKLYKERLKNSTPDNITYATFSTVYSVVNSLNGCKYDNKILDCRRGSLTLVLGRRAGVYSTGTHVD